MQETRPDRALCSSFRKGAGIEKINLQREGNMAKPYQVKQVRKVIVKNKLGGTVDV